MSEIHQAGEPGQPGTVTQMVYGDDGRLQTVSDPSGNLTAFGYDANGNQILVYTFFDDPVGTSNDRTMVTHTEYDREGRVVSTAQYVLAGLFADFDVDNPPLEHQLWITHTLYNDLGQVEWSTDRFGNKTFNLYDPTGNLIETRTMVKADVETTIGATTVPPGTYFQVTRTAYDNNGRTIAVTDPMLYQAMGDALGSRVTDAADLRLTHTIYDAVGRVVETRRLVGVEITITNVPIPGTGSITLPKSQFTPPASPNILTASVTEYQDDGLVKLTKSQIFDFNGSASLLTEELITWFRYDQAQRQTHTIQVVDFNQSGGPLEVEYDPTTGIPTGGNDVIISETIYDASGRQERTIDARGNATSFIYDGLGRVKETRGQQTGASPGFDYVATKTEYDLLGRRRAAIDAVGNRTEYGYDASGRLTSVKLPQVYDAISTNHLHPIYSYSYDVNGNQLSIEDPKGNETRFTYDHLNRQTSRTLLIGVSTTNNSNDFVERMVYNDANLGQLVGPAEHSVGLGELEYSVSFEGIVTAHRYDNTATGAGRLVATYYYLSLQDYVADRDDNGTLDDWKEKRSFQYDAYGRNVAVSFQETDGPNIVTTRTERTTFDADGRLAHVDSPEGVLTHEYDRAGRMTRTYASTNPITTDTVYGFDVLGRIVSVTDSLRSAQTRYYFDANGNLDATVLPNGITSDYVYDQLNRLTSLTHCIDTGGPNANRQCDLGETVRQKFEYTVRADGKRTRAVETNQSNDVSTFDWFYDQLGRLVDEVYQSGTNPNDNYIARYEFDLSSNRQRKLTDHAATTQAIEAYFADPDGDGIPARTLVEDQRVVYSYDANDRLRCEETLDDVQNLLNSIEYEYGLEDSTTQQTKKTELDDLGNTTKVTTSSYNLQGRMSATAVTETGQATVNSQYKYDSSGIRISQSVDGTITTYLIDAQNPTGYAQVLEEWIGGTLQRLYTLGHDLISQISVSSAASVSYFFLYDGHGSTRALLTDTGEIAVNAAQGNVPQVFTYDAYGNPINFTNSQALTNHLYSGEWTDTTTGWQYLRARYYDPKSGRFNRLDPFAGSHADPLSLHKYLYVHADPIQGIDPTGEATLIGVSLSVGVIGAFFGATVGAYVGKLESGTLFSLRTGTYFLVGTLAGFGIGASVGALLYELLPLTTSIGSGGALHNLIKVTPKIVQVVSNGPRSLFAANKGKVLASFIAGAASGALSANFDVPQITGFSGTASATAISLLFQSAIRPMINEHLAVYVSGSLDLILSFSLGYLAGYYIVRGEQTLLNQAINASFQLL